MELYREQTLTMTGSGTGYLQSGGLDYFDVPRLGDMGDLLRVVLREDATLNEASVVTIKVAATDTADPDSWVDEDIVYEYTALATTGSATDADLDDNLALDTAGAQYDCSDTTSKWLKAAVKVTTAGGGGASTSLELSLRARVTAP